MRCSRHLAASMVIAVAWLTTVVPYASADPEGIFRTGPINIGPAGIDNFNWQINDAGPSPTYPHAPGIPGPTPGPNNYVSGWTELKAVSYLDPTTGIYHPGNLNWAATSLAGNQLQFSLETLLGPTTAVGQSPDGAMSDFDPMHQYSWPFLSWDATYTGPTDSATLTADTLFDTSLFANPVSGPISSVFSIQLDLPNRQMDLIYTPVPEPGTLALVGLGAFGIWRSSRGRTTKPQAAQ